MTEFPSSFSPEYPFPAIATSIPDSESFDKENVQQQLTALELEKRHVYVTQYDADVDNYTTYIKDLHPFSEISITPLGVGSTKPLLIRVDQQKRYILKKVRPDPVLFEDPTYQTTVLPKLQECASSDLKEKVESTFFDYSFMGFDTPYIIEGQREKLAYAIGGDIGVPKVQLLATQEGIFSLHDYVPDSFSAQEGDIIEKINEMDLSSLQKITIFDIVVANRDRSPDNLLLISEGAKYKVIPIDHAQILRTSAVEFKSSLRLPFLYYESMMDQPLTDDAKSYINHFNIEDIQTQCVQNNIRLDDLARQHLEDNLNNLKNISSQPDITLKGLYDSFYEL